MLVKFKPGPNRLNAAKILMEELATSLREAKKAVDYGEFKCTEQSYEEVKKKIESNGGLIIEHT